MLSLGGFSSGISSKKGGPSGSGGVKPKGLVKKRKREKGEEESVMSLLEAMGQQMRGPEQPPQAKVSEGSSSRVMGHLLVGAGEGSTLLVHLEA